MNLRSLREALKSPRARVDQLRVVIETVKTDERLDSLPDVVSSLLESYDSPNLNPQLRADVYELLAGTTELCRIVANPAFSLDEALPLLAQHQAITARMLQHLALRPSNIGYSILNPKTGALVGHYSTEGEAGQQLAMMQRLGRGTGKDDLLVVPVSITSRYALRPLDEPSAPNPIPPPSYTPDVDEIPMGILPNDRIAAPTEGLKLESDEVKL